MSLPPKYLLPVFFLVLLAGATILGPILYFGLTFVYPTPFHRAMDRALLISAVVALGLAWSRIPLGKLWPRNGDAWKDVLLGVFIAAVAAQAMIAGNLALSGNQRMGAVSRAAAGTDAGAFSFVSVLSSESMLTSPRNR